MSHSRLASYSGHRHMSQEPHLALALGLPSVKYGHVRSSGTDRRTRTRKTEKCTEGERCGLNVCVVPSLNGRVPFNLRRRERDKRGADKRELIKSITNCRLTTACTGLYTEEDNKNYLTEKYEGRQ